jgi:hypothetical protein
MAKIRINHGSYTFDASAKQITFTGYVSIELEAVMYICNVKRGIEIYDFASSEKLGSVATNVLTLVYDTSSMSDTDELLIIYDDSLIIPAKETGGNLAAILAKLSSDPATQTTLAAILAKLVSTPALEGGNLATIAGKDFATQTTLAAILAKITSDPATQTTLAAILTALDLTKNTGNVDSKTLRVITAADGPLNTNLGTTADAAISTDTTGSISGKIRGLVKIFADVWNSVTHVLNVSATAVVSKSVAQIVDWTAVAQNIVAPPNVLDVSNLKECLLSIQAALDTTTAHTGTRFIVQISSNTTGDEDWEDLGADFVGLIGTAATDLIENNPLAAGATSITLTGHALTVKAKWLLIKNATLINSELVFESNSATNSITLLDGTTNAHALNTPIFNVVMTQVVSIPRAANRLRVIVDNSYDSDGSSLIYKLRVSKATSL